MNSKPDKYRIPYFNCCVRMFAKRYGLDNTVAFRYLYKFGGIDFLVEFYDAEHLLSLDDAVDDLTAVCRQKGGTI